MSKLKFELNKSGVRELLRSKEMQNILSEKGKETTGRLGEGYENKLYVAETRAVVQVSANSFKAKQENSEKNTLLKAVHK